MSENRRGDFLTHTVRSQYLIKKYAFQKTYRRAKIRQMTLTSSPRIYTRADAVRAITVTELIGLFYETVSHCRNAGWFGNIRWQIAAEL